MRRDEPFVGAVRWEDWLVREVTSLGRCDAFVCGEEDGFVDVDERGESVDATAGFIAGGGRFDVEGNGVSTGSTAPGSTTEPFWRS